MSESPKLEFKSPSLESLSSSVHTVDDIKSIEGLLFEAIEQGKIEELNSILNDESINTLVLQILLMKTIPNNDEKYCLEQDPSVSHLLGYSFTNLNVLQLVCLLGDEEMAIALFDFLLRMTMEMDSKILLLEFIHRTFGKNNTVLHLAAYLGFTHLVQKLIESGASVYVRNDNNYKPIDLVDDPETSIVFNNTHSAPPRSERGHDNVPKKISRQNTPTKLYIPALPDSHIPPKKKKSVKFDYTSTLLDICKNGLPKTMTIADFKTLLGQCNFLEIASPQKNMSLLHIACSYGHSDILKALLEPATELLNQQDVEGWSPAHCASAEGHLNILRLLGKYGPVIGNNLWEFFAEYPLDLDLKTYDGESIEDISIPENRDHIIKLLNDLRSLQTMAGTVDSGSRSLNRSDNVLSDPEMCMDVCSSLDSSNQDILGSITEVLNLSKESIIASQPPFNKHLITQDSSFDNDKENTHLNVSSDQFTDTDGIRPDSPVQNGEKDISDSISSHPTDVMLSSTLTLTPLEISSEKPRSIESRRLSDQDLNLKSMSDGPAIITKSKTDDDIRPPHKSLRKPPSDLGSTLSKETKSGDMPASNSTICELNTNLKAIDSTAITLKSRNPFLQMIVDLNTDKKKSLSLKDPHSDQKIHAEVAKSQANGTQSPESEEDFSGLTIRERLKRLKQLGVQ